MQPEFNRTNDGRVMADFVALCKRKDEKRVKKDSFVCLSLPKGGCFYQRFLPMRPFYTEFNGEY